MSKRLPPLNALHVFVVTARHLNLTRAAEELCVTQGAASRQIAALEEHFGFPLFLRHARGLHLTLQGQSLLPAIQGAFEQIQDAAEQVAKAHPAIRLKAPTCAMRWLLPQLMQLEQARPDIQIELTTTTQHHVNFMVEAFDAAILFGVYASDRSNMYKLFDEELIPICAPGLLKEPLNAPEAAAGYTLLHPTRDQRDWQLWFQSVGVPKQTARRNQHFDTMDLAISAAIQGFGIAIGDRTLIEEDLKAGRLVIPFPQSVLTGAAYYLTHHTQPTSPALLGDFVQWFTGARAQTA